LLAAGAAIASAYATRPAQDVAAQQTKASTQAIRRKNDKIDDIVLLSTAWYV
jgi:hypothetical protein